MKQTQSKSCVSNVLRFKCFEVQTLEFEVLLTTWKNETKKNIRYLFLRFSNMYIYPNWAFLLFISCKILDSNVWIKRTVLRLRCYILDIHVIHGAKLTPIQTWKGFFLIWLLNLISEYEVIVICYILLWQNTMPKNQVKIMQNLEIRTVRCS